MTQEVARAFGGRRIEDLGGRPLLDDPACVEHRDPVGDTSCERHFVRDDDHCHAVVRKTPHYLKHFLYKFGIQGRGHFVE